MTGKIFCSALGACVMGCSSSHRKRLLVRCSKLQVPTAFSSPPRLDVSAAQNHQPCKPLQGLPSPCHTSCPALSRLLSGISKPYEALPNLSKPFSEKKDCLFYEPPDPTSLPYPTRGATHFATLPNGELTVAAKLSPRQTKKFALLKIRKAGLKACDWK